MSASVVVALKSEAQRWAEWQNRALDGDRRRAVAMRWVVAVIVIALGLMFGRAW